MVCSGRRAPHKVYSIEHNAHNHSLFPKTGDALSVGGHPFPAVDSMTVCAAVWH